MAKEFFKNFPEMQYKLDSGKLITIKDFFRKATVDASARDSVIEYTYHELEEGDRPDVLASKLYGNGDLHWTFFLVNDLNNYYDWWKDQSTFQKYIEKKLRGHFLIAENSTDIVNATKKFHIGETVTGTNSEAVVVEVDPTFKRLGIEIKKGFDTNILTTGTIKQQGAFHSFTPSSIIERKDGIAYYYNGEIKSNTFKSGYLSKSLWEDEYEKNEEKRKIKIIRPSKINAIVRSFEKVMRS
mgnify:FL=1|jgi:hypothetical protein|tara:strand:- start:1873 stop:2595 length:723 start_codon:yes stop_codon:yes gene_type:complete